MSDTPQTRDERREQFYTRLIVEYGARFPESLAFHEQTNSVLVGGGSHTARLSDPFPAWTQTAQGAHVSDLDGHTILDFWQGHFANLLGHNPPEITAALVESLQAGHGLQSGMQDTLEWELADLLCGFTGAEKVRFTTSGSLATMYAVLLARVYTGRTLVLKVGGGWHGAQPWSLKGVGFSARAYQGLDTEGLPGRLTDELLVTTFQRCGCAGSGLSPVWGSYRLFHRRAFHWWGRVARRPAGILAAGARPDTGPWRPVDLRRDHRRLSLLRRHIGFIVWRRAGLDHPGQDHWRRHAPRGGGRPGRCDGPVWKGRWPTGSIRGGHLFCPPPSRCALHLP